ncbi:Carboxylesterase family-domain-containing protein [Collybia nuda]|uniref:Carboxylic ester hydrolase n=1 Tax=Collybia nuda TaxID=64659 RepID=A0A9P5YB84_9AGAR|nr:Carboxylesterase family-domain-containing protein [Collybia nuda]
MSQDIDTLYKTVVRTSICPDVIRSSTHPRNAFYPAGKTRALWSLNITVRNRSISAAPAQNIMSLRNISFFTLAILASFGNVQARNLDTRADTNGLIVDLGTAGIYEGILQNNGTVQSWKGIPYAAAPVGDLRFKGPRPLPEQSSEVIDVSDDALRCIQFGGVSNIIGVKAGPGVEDCLKLWIWKPVSAKKNSKLPVVIYTHGGGLQFSSAPNNDFSDWVGQEQNFIAINPAYRLGAFGFIASEDLTKENETANAGLLDQRFAVEWVKKNIAAFGGNPNDITIQGQSGGGLAVITQLVLFDGKGAPFQKAIARSIQRGATFTIAEHKERNNKLAEILGCSGTTSQIACFRNASPADFVKATDSLSMMKSSNGLVFGGFLPTIDGVTLTDTVTKLLQKGKFAQVPFIGGHVTDEAAGVTPKDVSRVDASIVGQWNLSASNIEKALKLYPVNSSFGSASGTGNFFLSTFDAAVHANAGFGEGGITCSERVANYAFSRFGPKSGTWGVRFEAPTVSFASPIDDFPLAQIPHSADNSYLQITECYGRHATLREGARP